MDSGVRHLKMAELSSATGLPASTIRYYLGLGLLPEPIRTAPTMAYYGDEHRDRLVEIRRRLRAGATLHDLRVELGDSTSMSVPDSPAGIDGQPLYSSQRARLIDAGSVVFLRSGFEAASVEEIVAQAGVSKGAFYGLFGSKQDLLAAIVDGELDWYDGVVGKGEPSIDRLLTHADLYLDPRLRRLIALFALLRQADASSADHHDEALISARARLRAPLESDLRAARAAGVDDERLCAEMLLSAAEYVLAYAAETENRNVPDLIRRGWRFILREPGHG